MTAPYWLNPAISDDFPDVSLALRDPDGLLAIGGDLSAARLVNAYRHGIFPWYSENQPILWWSPDPRSILFPEALHISKSLRKTLRKGTFKVTIDKAFEHVIQACSNPRDDGQGTWIIDEMREAYQRLHREGYAHSVECWQDNKLVGGLYGVSIGKVFFGESMFARVSDASKVAFVHLVLQCHRWQIGMIDCQIQSAHLDSFGAVLLPRSRFIELLNEYCPQAHNNMQWHFDSDLIDDLSTYTSF